jgi:drug/metabolite transporter (DMT)-like permease
MVTQAAIGSIGRFRLPAMSTLAPPLRRPLDSSAIALMLLLTMLWGLQQVAIKLAMDGVSPVTQAAIRSIVAALLLILWARARGIALWQPAHRHDGTLWAGLGAGLLFAAEFVFIYSGLAHTTASRMVVFVYLAPILTALGLAWLVPGEKLAPLQWAGVLTAFGGLVLAFVDGLVAAGGGSTLLGDAFGVIAAVLWAATTVLVRKSALSHASAETTLAWQLGVSALLLPLAAWALGEPGVLRVDAMVLGSLLFQSVVVAFASYLAWFWLLTRYLAGRLAVFSFLAPLFGVLFGVLILGDALSLRFGLAAALVGVGIALVNLRR